MGNCFCKGEEAPQERRDSLPHSQSPQSASASPTARYASADSMLLDDSAPSSTTFADDCPFADDDLQAHKQLPLEVADVLPRNERTDTAAVDDAVVGEQQQQQPQEQEQQQQTQQQVEQLPAHQPDDHLSNSNDSDLVDVGRASISMCSSRTMSENSAGNGSNTGTSRSSSFDSPKQIAPAEPAASRSEQFRPAAAPGAVPAILGIPGVPGSGGGGGGSRSGSWMDGWAGMAHSNESLLSFVGGSSVGDSDSRESIAALPSASRSASYSTSVASVVVTPRSASSDLGDQLSLVDATLAASATSDVEMPHAVAARGL